MTDQQLDLDGPWDLVVVGHGAAGLSAAASFLEHHTGDAPRVAVLDKAGREHRGGSTAWSTSAFRLDKDMQLSQDWAETVRASNTQDRHVEGYIDAFYEHAVDTLNWIRRRGVSLVRFPNAVPGLLWSHHNSVEGGGRAFVDTFAELVETGGATLLYETEAIGLEREPGGPVTGVRVRRADGTEHLLSTSAVVLASGGFEGNPELLGQHITGGEHLEVVAPGTQVNTGGGIEIAVQVGAARAGQYSGAHIEPVDPRSELPEALVMSWMFGILVDTDGKRFLDESSAAFDRQFDVVGNAIQRQTPARKAFAITDAAARAQVPNFGYLNLTTVAPIVADTIEGLAEKLSIDPAALADTVQAFNAATDTSPPDYTGLDGKATRGLEPPKSNWSYPVAEGPFEAWPVVPTICFTYGGLQVDGATHVLDESGAVIDGLHAAGEIVGTFYDVYPSATSVLRSLTFGRLAGQAIAERAAASVPAA